jgi:LacI family gluconate utilization system Gnt-I transcriptional repressor
LAQDGQWIMWARDSTRFEATPEGSVQSIGKGLFDGCHPMVRSLYKTGRRRIGFIGGTTNADTRGSERRLGYQQAVRELRLPASRVVALGKPPASMSQGTKALDLMLRRWPDTDARTRLRRVCGVRP